MSDGIDRRAWVGGTLVCLAIAVPAVLAIQILDELGGTDASSPTVLAVVAVIGTALGVGGYTAGVRGSSAPLIHGLVAALTAYAMIQSVALVRILVGGHSVQWVAIPFFALVAGAIGVAGATVAEVRTRRRPGQRSEL